MVELTRNEGAAVPASIPASTQILAVAWMRWRMFANGTFRRRPVTGQRIAGIVFAVLLRILAWPIMALMVIGPVVGSGVFAWQAIAHHHPQSLAPLLAGIVILWQFISINGLSIAASVSTFDPASLVRFPLRFGRYLVLRTLLGLLAPSTIVGCLALLSAAIGIGIAQHALLVPALLVLGVFALMNIFLTRMLGAWMERWLANRRFREIFNMLLAGLAISFQFFNLQQRGHGPHSSWLLQVVMGPGEYLRWLPPGYAAGAILGLDRPLTAFFQFVLLIATTTLFAAVFAIRLHRQFLGENLSEGSARRDTTIRDSGSRDSGSRDSAVRAKTTSHSPAIAATSSDRSLLPPTIAACLRKEWVVLRGNSSQLIGMITPLIFVVLLNRANFLRNPSYFLPAAVAYVLLGLVAHLYNVFGGDGRGVQLYLLAPVRLRDVLIAKNLVGVVMLFTEAAVAWVLVLLLSRSPIPLATQVATAFWTVFVIGVNLTIGSLRSIQAPHKFTPGQMRIRRGAPANRTSSLIILVVMFGSMVLQFPVAFLGGYLHQPWFGVIVFAPLAFGAAAAYVVLLQNAESLILAHREVFAEELCKG